MLNFWPFNIKRKKRERKIKQITIISICIGSGFLLATAIGVGLGIGLEYDHTKYKFKSNSKFWNWIDKELNKQKDETTYRIGDAESAQNFLSNSISKWNLILSGFFYDGFDTLGLDQDFAGKFLLPLHFQIKTKESFYFKLLSDFEINYDVEVMGLNENLSRFIKKGSFFKYEYDERNYLKVHIESHGWLKINDGSPVDKDRVDYYADADYTNGFSSNEEGGLWRDCFVFKFIDINNFENKFYVDKKLYPNLIVSI